MAQVVRVSSSAFDLVRQDRSNTRNPRRFSDSDGNEPQVAQMRKLIYDMPFYALPGIGSDLRHMSRDWSKANVKKIEQMQRNRQQSNVAPIPNEVIKPDSHGLTATLLLTTIGVVLGSLQFGFNIGILNPMSSDVRKEFGMEKLNSKGELEPDWKWNLASSIFAIGGGVGAYVGGIIADRFGRKHSLNIGSIFMICATLLEVFASEAWMMIVARFFVGCCSGTFTVVVPLYLGEISTANLRGALGTMNQLAVTVGILLGQVLYKPFNNASADKGWRWNIGVCAVVGALQILMYPFMYESPRWLLSVGRDSEGEEALKKLRGDDNIDFEFSTYVQADAQGDKANERSLASLMWDLINDRRVRLPLLIGAGLQVTQQLSGINAVMMYSNDFFKSCGVTDSWLATILCSGVNVIATVAAVDLMDRLGRRVLLIGSSIGMIGTLVFLTILGAMEGSAVNWLKIITVLVYVVLFAVGLGPIPWLIGAEIFTPEKRGTAMSLCSMVNWLFTFVVGLIFPFLNTWLTGKYCFLPFAGFLVLATLMIMWYVPETRRKSIEQIQAELAGISAGVAGADGSKLLSGQELQVNARGDAHV